MLVGQAPGKVESAGGRAFAGRAGNTLFRWLAQIGLFVAPVLVILSFLIGPTPMALVFNGYELAALIFAALLSTTLIADGESTWFEGVQLLGVYALLGLVFYYA